MAKRRIKRLDITDNNKYRLEHQKFIFIKVFAKLIINFTCTKRNVKIGRKRIRLTNFKDILNKNRYELMRMIEVSLFSADEILLKASKACVPKRSTCLDLWKRNHGKRFLPTSIGPLDRVLHGGLPCGTVTEIAGPSGCGKTQICTMLALLAARNPNGSVLYIDTESAFSAERLIEMARNKFPEDFASDENVSLLSERIHVYLESTCDALLKRLENLEQHIIEEKACLIIVDSIASLIRKEYDSRTGRNMVERANLLVRQAAILKHVAETFNIPKMRSAWRERVVTSQLLWETRGVTASILDSLCSTSIVIDDRFWLPNLQ